MFFLSLSLYGNADGRPDRDSPTMVSPWKPSQVYGDSRYSDMGCSALREKITPEATWLGAFLAHWLAPWTGPKVSRGDIMALNREARTKQIVIQKQ